MRILIIEDEPLAQEELVRLIDKCFPTFEILALLDSIESSVVWLKNNHADLIFMDIQLSDGISFDIFEQMEVEAPVIFTTAYDQYAVRAFQVNGIGYLLKPIVEADLVKAIGKVDTLIHRPDYLKKLVEALQTAKSYKNRISIKSGDKFMSVDMAKVSYYYAEERVTFVVTNQNRRHIIDYTLEALEPMLDPRTFFRITRGCIASIGSIHSVSKYFNSRLKIKLDPALESELLVSRVRVPAFLKWLDGE